MKIKGLTEEQINTVLARHEAFAENMRTKGRFLYFKATPNSSCAKFARRSCTGRHIKALCFHGFRRIIQDCFTEGAQIIGSSVGVWNSEEKFVHDLGRIGTINIGSIMQPVRMLELCDCTNKHLS